MDSRPPDRHIRGMTPIVMKRKTRMMPPCLLALIRELAAYERLLHECEVDPGGRRGGSILVPTPTGLRRDRRMGWRTGGIRSLVLQFFDVQGAARDLPRDDLFVPSGLALPRHRALPPAACAAGAALHPGRPAAPRVVGAQTGTETCPAVLSAHAAARAMDDPMDGPAGASGEALGGLWPDEREPRAAAAPATATRQEKPVHEAHDVAAHPRRRRGRERRHRPRQQLLWRLKTDLRRFRDLTWGKPMIMGRKTFESIGRPLPGARRSS